MVGMEQFEVVNFLEKVPADVAKKIGLSLAALVNGERNELLRWPISVPLDLAEQCLRAEGSLKAFAEGLVEGMRSEKPIETVSSHERRARWEKSKVQQLAEELRQRELRVSGKKNEKIERLVEDEARHEGDPRLLWKMSKAERRELLKGDWQCVTKSRAMKEFRLSENDLLQLKCFEKENPHYATAAPMKLFRWRDLLECALGKHSSIQGIKRKQEISKESGRKRMRKQSAQGST